MGVEMSNRQIKHASDHAGPLNLYFCARHARIALERMTDGELPRRYEGHLRHVVYRLEREMRLLKDMLGPKWRERLRRRKYS
jgi:hypothetical protein